MERRLRSEIGEFARRELPFELGGGLFDYEEQFEGLYWETARRITPKLGRNGWLAPGWPAKYGGKGASPIEHLVCVEELAYWGVPGADMGVGGISWIGPTLMSVGNEAQKLEHLPYIAGGKQFWCTAYSEPGSGSDMASMSSRAVRQGDTYIVNGQKVWTSAALVADWCWLLVRTNPDVAKHKGLSLFLLDMHTRGVTVRPLPAMTGKAPFAEVFFDNVRIPAGNLVGEEGRAWNYIVGSLDYERSLVAVLFCGLDRRLMDELLRYVRERAPAGHRRPAGAIRVRLAETAVELEAARLLAMRAGLSLLEGRPSSAESAMAKLFSTEFSQRIAQLGMEIVGLFGQLAVSMPGSVLHERVCSAYLSSMGNTLLAGTSEIERNVIATRGLGLPSRRAIPGSKEDGR
ncbi:MAG: acyl-CoA dehydrogenase family protein [Chloroflexi bacterium]|nr:acyl-CoA dehydrogenase family protein [Chloroflexota bacterium]